ncbi:MAG: hypothetical protein HOO93_09325 [Methyloglobulus sp.]|nr:hypothetical protein [Methyloglobulus sp.]
MKSTLKNFILASSFMLMANSLNTQAACTIANTVGSWRFFAVTGSPSFQGFGRGTIAFTSTGALNTAASALYLSNGQIIKFSKGQAKLTSACRITGSLTTTVGVTITMVDGQMNSSKNVVSGVYKRSDGDVGLINLIR